MAPPGGGSSGALATVDALDRGFAGFAFVAFAFVAFAFPGLVFAALAFALGAVFFERFTFEVLAMGHSPI
jgi:hypothetical protein